MFWDGVCMRICAVFSFPENDDDNDPKPVARGKR
jgi:hypothetical protein